VRPYISRNVCTGCGECAIVCPYEVISGESGVMVITTPEDCIECGACIDVCPQKALFMDD